MLKNSLISTAIFCAMSMGDDVINVKSNKGLLGASLSPIDLSDLKKPVNGFQVKQRKRKARRKGNM